MQAHCKQCMSDASLQHARHDIIIVIIRKCCCDLFCSLEACKHLLGEMEAASESMEPHLIESKGCALALVVLFAVVLLLCPPLLPLVNCPVLRMESGVDA
jgi:hypothetical protein